MNFDAHFITGMALLGAGIAMTVGIGVGLGEGFAAGKAAEAVSKNPEAKSDIISTMIIGDAMADVSLILAFVIALMLLSK